MASIGERAQALWNTLSAAPATPPSVVALPRDHVQAEAAADGVLVGPILSETHYFQVRINEMYLTKKRKWLTEIVPVVLAITEFTYDGKPVVVPFTVGPSLLAKAGSKEEAGGLVFTNTRVAGIYPYRGDRLVLSVRLYQLAVGNVGQRVLSLVEGAAGALDFSTAISSYIKLADVVLDGMEGLLNLGGMTPIAGLRTEFDHQAGTGIVSPAYFVLIDSPDVDPQRLWVRGERLLTGPDMATATPYRDADFTLYSVVGSAARDDVPSLPWFGPLWTRVVTDSSTARNDSWKSAKANMSVLHSELVLSPDLIANHALLVSGQHVDLMKAIHDKAVGMANLAAEDVADDPRLERSAAILDL